MPSIAWFPFAIILFGVTTNAIIFVIVLGSAPSVANGLITGVDYTPPLLLRAGKTMGLRGSRPVPVPDPAGRTAGLRGRPQAGLGVRLGAASWQASCW